MPILKTAFCIITVFLLIAITFHTTVGAEKKVWFGCLGQVDFPAKQKHFILICIVVGGPGKSFAKLFAN